MKKLSIIFLLALAACNEQSTETKKVVINEKKVITTDTQKIDAASSVLDTTFNEGLTLEISPMAVDGNLGQVTFSQKGKTMFYFDYSAKKGEIILNGKKCVLNYCTFFPKDNSYSLMSDNVGIVTTGCKFKENEGTDCFYGKIKDVMITMDNAILELHDVDVQDCPSY